MSREGRLVARKVCGTVIWFGVQRGFGFISRADSGENVFAHRKAISAKNPDHYNPSLAEGEEVEFDVIQGEKGTEAINITGPRGCSVRGNDKAAGGLIARKVCGTVKWFDAQRDFGFISRADNGEDVFAHCSAISAKNPDHYGPTLAQGEEVEFDVIHGPKGFEAVNISGPRGSSVRGNDQTAQGGCCYGGGAPEMENVSISSEMSEVNGGDLTTPFEFADVTFIVQNKPIYYNRVFLAMHSLHFKRLFYGANAVHDKEIRLNDKKFEDILTMLKLLKLDPDRSEQLITDENVEDLLKLAEEYQLRQVTAECEKFLLLKWKFDQSKIVKALELSAKFGLRTAVNNLLVLSFTQYPSLLTDENVEQILSVAKEYQLPNVLELCENYILQHWKPLADKVVRAVELSAKFGLEKALANLLKTAPCMRPNITDGNIEQLLSLCKGYSLVEVRADCEAYIMNNWIAQSDKALRAVEISHELGLPNLAKLFIPLAACRPLAEIDLSMDKLSTELFCAIVHAALVKAKADCSRMSAEFASCGFRFAYTETLSAAAAEDKVVEEMIKRTQQNL